MKLTLLSVVVLSIWTSVKGDEHDHKVSLYSKYLSKRFFTLLYKI